MRWTIMVKKELSQKAKLLIYQFIYVPTLTYGHELRAVIIRMRTPVKVDGMSFLHRVACLSLRGRVRRLGMWRELRVETLLLCG